MKDKGKNSIGNFRLQIGIILFLSCVIFFYNKILGVVIFVGYSLITILNQRSSKVKKDEWSEIEKFSSKLDIASQNNLVKMPYPLIIASGKGSILWYNQKFHDILKERKILGEDIKNISKEIDILKFLNGTEKITFVPIQEKFYDISANIVAINEESENPDKVVLLYFIDTTEKYELLKDIEENKVSIMLIEVDNLDEVVKTTEEDKRPLLVAEIERSINSYAQNLNAMIEKKSQNKYVLAVEDKYIHMEMDKKFDILDHVRDLDIGNKLSATLSIGVGINGDTPLENHKYAAAAKELALGRGGDQVVVKNRDRLNFYGGKTQEFEKRTKVRARVIAHALVELINESSNIIIMGHVNPDMDVLGAGIGINAACRMLKKKCNIVIDDVNNGIKIIYNRVKELKDYEDTFISSESAKKLIEDNTLLVLVDVHGIDYVQNKDIVNKCKKRVIVDHHRKGPNYIEKTILSYIEVYASSTSELVTEMLQYMVDNPKLKVEEAEALLAGICVDTKNFYFKTGVRTFEAAAFLRRLGADTIDIKKVFSNDLDRYLKRAEIIKSAEVENNVAVATCPKDIKDPIVAAQAADELLNITNIEASFVLIEINNDILISGRSLGDINVQVILEKLGGGGHITMAGARIKDSTIDRVCELLKEEIGEYLKESDK
ncbi:DHH family phosphoesterase [Haloimpatiens lingqiaonensis]|uniref:DHH family phosphoesterase n=1 Tax=Haloimpatiens lingqiaonensis TaxID=1380675 RepID=UPI0010FF0818|nr:DHH family phosphoesterase [Haloimpatiens lingqiaonensis]